MGLTGLMPLHSEVCAQRGSALTICTLQPLQQAQLPACKMRFAPQDSQR